MCGINCIINKKQRFVDPDLIERANRALLHRGPDEQASYIFENVALGITRLSIVDVGGGHQPLFNETKSCALVYNGEIYNYMALREKLVNSGHNFSSGSDGETIIHLYEDDREYVSRLNGMFSFVLLDIEKRLVHIARDRLGIKPLFKFENDQWLILSSEIKGILATGLVSREFDRTAIWDSFTFNYIPGSATMFGAVRQFPPAVLGELSLIESSSKFSEYWQFSFPSKRESNTLKISPYVKQLNATMKHSVKSHLVGDVEIASYLSGGVDSTVTSILLKQLYKTDLPIKTFSILFQDKTFDESLIINETNRLFNFDSHCLRFSTVDSRAFAKTLFHLEQPQGSPLDVPLNQLAALVRENNIKVVLSGEGSDEIFGGYYFFVLNQIRRALDLPIFGGFKDKLLSRALRYFIGSADDRETFLSLYSKEAEAIVARFGTFPPWYPIWHGANNSKRDLFETTYRDSLGDDSPIVEICDELKSKYRSIDDFNKTIFVECKTRLPNYILTRVDRNAMAHSVEARVPFLSNEMIDLSCEIPPLCKMLGLREKYILRKAFKTILPSQVRRGSKFAYNAPAQSLWNGVDELRDEVMSEASLRKVGIFNVESIQRLRKTLSTNALSPSQRETAYTNLTRVLSVQLISEAGNS